MQSSPITVTNVNSGEPNDPKESLNTDVNKSCTFILTLTNTNYVIFQAYKNEEGKDV